MAERHAIVGWGAVFGVVVAYDGWALINHKETLSACFARGAESRLGKVLVNGAWVGLSWHLMRGGHQLLPEPFQSHYRRLHPLWRLHDEVLARANARIVEVSASLSEFSGRRTNKR